MSLRLTIRLLNLKRPHLNRVVQVLTGHCNLQRHKKTTGRAESSLCPKCSLEDETQNHVGQGRPTFFSCRPNLLFQKFGEPKFIREDQKKRSLLGFDQYFQPKSR